MSERNASPWEPASEPEVELKLEDASCDMCGKTLERSAMHRVQGQLRCGDCFMRANAEQSKLLTLPVGSQPLRPLGSQPLGPPIHRPDLPVARTYVEPAQPASSMIGAVVCGLIGALVGAAIWAAIAIATHMERGYVATLVGFLAGMGVKYGAGISGGPAQRAIAVVMAIAGLLAAKYVTIAYGLVEVAHRNGLDVGYLGKYVLSRFPDELVRMLSPFDALWLFLAIGAAYRVSRPSTT